MDPLTILGSTIACIQIVDRTGGVLAQAQSIFDAPKEFEDFLTLVKEWKTLLQSIRYACASLDMPDDDQNINDVRNLVEEAGKVILRVEQTVAYDIEHASSDVQHKQRKIRRLRWVRSKGRLSDSKERLLDLRSKISSHLVLISLSHMSGKCRSLEQLITQVAGNAINVLQTQKPSLPLASSSFHSDSIVCEDFDMMPTAQQIVSRSEGDSQAGWAGFPNFAINCDTKSCKGINQARVDCAIRLPSWLISRALLITVVCSQPRGPELQLRTLRIRSASDPVFTLAVQGDIEKLKDLFAAGEASVIDVNERHESALLLAVDHRQVETAQFLLQQGAIATQEDAIRRTPYDMAWNTILSPTPRTTQVCEQLKDLFPSADILDARQFSLLQLMILGLFVGDVDQAIQDQECSINYGDADGNTALSWAAKLGQVDVVSKLIAHGADAYLANTGARTPLHRAVVAANPSCIVQLLEAGANVDALDFQDSTPLHYAASCSYAEEDVEAYFQPLLDAGANIHAQTNRGQSALHIALERNITNNARYLLRAGADVNLRNSEKASPLAYAIQFNRVEVLEMMLQQESNPCFGGDLFLLVPASPRIMFDLQDEVSQREEIWRNEFNQLISHAVTRESEPKVEVPQRLRNSEDLDSPSAMYFDALEHQV
ncbi:hypothetical protein Q7P37_009242 [Cladosporium fusiforme]